MLNADDQKIQDLLTAWHANQLATSHKTMSPDTIKNCYTKVAKQRAKYIALDNGGSGHFMVDRSNGRVYSIKGYGVIDRKKDRGSVEYLTRFINQLTAEGKEYQHQFWYKLHPVD